MQALRARPSVRRRLSGRHVTQIQHELLLPTLSDAQLSQHRTSIEGIRTGALEQAQALSDPIAEIKAQLAKLGPAPAAGQTEAEAIAGQRKDLAETLQRLEGAKKQLELIAVEAEQSGARAAALQKDRFFSRIFESGRSVFNPDLWTDAAAGANQFAERLAALLQAWWTTCQTRRTAQRAAVDPGDFAVAFVAYEVGAAWLRRRFRTRTGDKAPDDLARLWRVCARHRADSGGDCRRRFRRLEHNRHCGYFNAALRHAAARPGQDRLRDDRDRRSRPARGVSRRSDVAT